jgi:hypothetical protein
VLPKRFIRISDGFEPSEINYLIFADMEHFDLIGELQRVALANDWAFLAGDDFYMNIGAAQEEYKPNKLVLAVDMNASPTIVNGRVVEVTYSGAMMLGIKEDVDGVQSSLDEMFIEKYQKRLLMLHQLLAQFIGDFACSRELELSGVTMSMDINRFDTNIDFVAMTLTITQ